MATDTDRLGDALARASRGEEAGFLELWRALQPRLLRYLRVLGCEDPDDVASETWLQVVRDLRRFSGSAEDFRRWLFSIGRHRAIDAARARSRRPARAEGVGLDILADAQVVEDQVLESLSVRQAVSLLSRLSRDQAEAVALRVIAGLETTDVAQILGKSAGAVRVALHRGLRTLAGDPSVRELALLNIAAGGGARPATVLAATVPAATVPASTVPAATGDAVVIATDSARTITEPHAVLPPPRPGPDLDLWTREEVN
jgi:RNA polymerase sigma-70 factor, ECF subfamily